MNQSKPPEWAFRIARQPVYQALIIFLCSACFSILGWATSADGLGTTADNSPWIMMTAGILFYAIVSSVFSLVSVDQKIYWRNAIFTFMGMAAASGVVAMVISGKTIDEAGSFRWIYVVLAIGYLVFGVIVSLMRKIVEIAVKQDKKMRGE